MAVPGLETNLPGQRGLACTGTWLSPERHPHTIQEAPLPKLRLPGNHRRGPLTLLPFPRASCHALIPAVGAGSLPGPAPPSPGPGLRRASASPRARCSRSCRLLPAHPRAAPGTPQRSCRAQSGPGAQGCSSQPPWGSPFGIGSPGNAGALPAGLHPRWAPTGLTWHGVVIVLPEHTELRPDGSGLSSVHSLCSLIAQGRSSASPSGGT